METPDRDLTPANDIPVRLSKPRLRRWEASEYLEIKHGLRVAPATLAKLASVGGGPAFNRAGRVPLYPTGELDQWAKNRLGRLINSTSEIPLQQSWLEKIRNPRSHG